MDSRYIRIVKTPIPKRKRVVKLHGAFEDRGVWFICWVCGAINNVNRNVVDQGYGNTAEETPVQSDPGFPLDGTMQKQACVMERITDTACIKKGQDNQPITTYYSEKRTRNSCGCWFCGSTNIF